MVNRSIDLQLCLTGSNRSIERDFPFLSLVLLLLLLLHLLAHLIIPDRMQDLPARAMTLACSLSRPCSVLHPCNRGRGQGSADLSPSLSFFLSFSLSLFADDEGNTALLTMQFNKLGLPGSQSVRPRWKCEFLRHGHGEECNVRGFGILFYTFSPTSSYCSLSPLSFFIFLLPLLRDNVFLTSHPSSHVPFAEPREKQRGFMSHCSRLSRVLHPKRVPALPAASRASLEDLLISLFFRLRLPTCMHCCIWHLIP